MERPLLFSDPMVRAIFWNIKRQTRRIVKPTPYLLPAWVHRAEFRDGALHLVDADGIAHAAWDRGRNEFAPGMSLWIRECWARAQMADGREFAYRATGDVLGCQPWKPSIHMPRAASRLSLAVTEVRIERLQDLSAEDAIAEGLSKVTKDSARTWKYGIPDRDGLPGIDNDGWPWREWDVDPRKAYRKLRHINGPESWQSNPWVWVISFRRAR